MVGKMAEKEVQNCKVGGKKTTTSSKSNDVGQENVPPVRTSKTSSAVSAAAPSSTPQGLNKEVLLILQELNKNVNAQNTRLEKQEERLKLLSDRMSNTENDLYEYYEDCQDDSPVSEACNASTVNEECPSSSVFKSLVDKFQQIDAVDAEVNEDLAGFVNSSFRNGISDEKQSELLKDIHRPENCSSLTKTRVNQGIWRLLKMNTQADDNRMQTIQNLVVKASCNIVKLLDKCGENFESQEIEWGSNALALLGQANRMINIRRKEVHKADLDAKYHYLASPSVPYTDLLYGDDVDVNKTVREINDMNKIGRIGRNYYSYPSRGARGSFRRPHPYRRSGFRGRGRPRQDNQMGSKNLKVAPKK